MLLTLLIFLLILTVLIVIHEAGHYFVAKKFGIKVEEFGFGLPLSKAIWSKKYGETVYSIYPALIGGFVKLYGEDEAGAGRIAAPKEEDKKTHNEDVGRAFFSRSPGQRTLVIVAGVLMNTLLAVGIYYVFLGLSNFTTELPLIGHHTFFGVHQYVRTQIIVSGVAKNSPAEKAGITEFSQITGINGAPVQNLDTFLKTIKADRGKQVTISWKDIRTEHISHATVIPRLNPPKNEGSLGVAFFPVDTVILSYDSPLQKVFSGFTHPANLMLYNLDAMKTLIGLSVKEKTVAPLGQGVSGPIGIGFVVGSIVNIPDLRERTMQLLNFAGILSASLAFFNVLPIPGLDGGRLFFIILEVIFRRKVDPKIEGYAHAIGMSVLLAIVLMVSINDVQVHKVEIIQYFQQLLKNL